MNISFRFYFLCSLKYCLKHPDIKIKVSYLYRDIDSFDKIPDPSRNDVYIPYYKVVDCHHTRYKTKTFKVWTLTEIQMHAFPCNGRSNSFHWAWRFLLEWIAVAVIGMYIYPHRQCNMYFLFMIALSFLFRRCFPHKPNLRSDLIDYVFLFGSFRITEFSFVLWLLEWITRKSESATSLPLDKFILGKVSVTRN